MIKVSDIILKGRFVVILLLIAITTLMYYLARVKVATDNGKKVTWKKEAYLVNAVTVTDAEAIVNKDFADDMVEFEVVEVKKSDVIKVL